MATEGGGWRKELEAEEIAERVRLVCKERDGGCGEAVGGVFV